MEEPAGERRTVQVRDFDVELWSELRAAAVRRRATTSSLLGRIIREWLRAQKGGPKGPSQTAAAG